MNIIPTLIILWIVWSFFKKFGGAQKTKNKTNNKTMRSQGQKSEVAADQSWSYDNAGSGPWGKPATPPRRESYIKQTGQQTLQQRLAAAKKSVPNKLQATKKTKTERYNQTGLNLPNEDDLNPNRREDWGVRGDRVLTPKTIVTIIGLGFILLFVLSGITPSDLGL